ncbi:NUDIX hydrolase [Solibacillus sp. FSL R5-0691]|uniref:NUDIX hydrolase n=1 Tax=Solibacillus sp. FSL R5-0691 TaxID=2921653 RepID=UPI0030CBCE2D
MGYIMELRKKIGTDPIIMVGACVLIVNEKTQLLLQYRKDNNSWGLPGGAMELGESLEEVAVREMEEETGLTPTRLVLFRTFSGKEFYYKYPHGDEVYNVVTAFICKNYEGSIKFDESEATDIRFFDLTDLPVISPPDDPVIKDFLKTCN